MLAYLTVQARTSAIKVPRRSGPSRGGPGAERHELGDELRRDPGNGEVAANLARLERARAG